MLGLHLVFRFDLDYVFSTKPAEAHFAPPLVCVHTAVRKPAKPRSTTLEQTKFAKPCRGSARENGRLTPPRRCKAHFAKGCRKVTLMLLTLAAPLPKKSLLRKSFLGALWVIVPCLTLRRDAPPKTAGAFCTRSFFDCDCYAMREARGGRPDSEL